MADNISLKRAQQITQEYAKQTDYAKNLGILSKNLSDSLGDTSAAGKRVTKFLETGTDLAADFLENIDKVGSSDFMKQDFTKQIQGLQRLKAVLPADKFKQIEESLIEMQKGAENLENADIFSKNMAENFENSAKSLTGMIGKVPIFGKALSELADKKIKGVSDSISNKIGSVFTGQVKGAPTAKSTGMIKKSSKQWKAMGKMQKGAMQLGKAFRTAGMIGKIAIGATVGIIIAAVALIAKMAKGIFDFANKTGLSYAQTVKLGGALAVNEKAVTAISKEFGNINEITTGTAIQMKRMSLQYAITEENAAKILRIQKAVSGATNSQLLNMQMQTAQLARQRGVAPADLFDDIASSTEAFAKFSADGGKNVMAAAVSAKQLGLNLSVVEKVAEGLLDIEGSINKQMEASVLIGRELNLDRARQLALSGDLEGVLREVKNQVGGEAEFNRMNVIQRNKLAEAVGLSTAELARLTTANANTLTAGAAATGAAVSEGVKAQVDAIGIAGDNTVKAVNNMSAKLD
jgi:hypothetical protein